jgi:bifunctional UDP-N-acetylglucosamine pyrophosphorylase/glucosamine-1-phosphate N-acetyltransferase
MATALIVLAAGLGTRMNSDLPKVLHRLAGVPLVIHALRAGSALEPDRTIVVTGHGAEAVTKAVHAWDDTAIIALQPEQKGTGHAVACALPALQGFTGRVIVLYGDTPFLTPETLEKLNASPADVTFLGFRAEDPKRYGRLIADGDELLRIVEWKDASPQERNITLCNSGVMACDADLLATLIPQLGTANAAGEYYLTDLVTLARKAGRTASVVTCEESETLGIDSRAGLAEAEAIFQARARAQAMEDGVTLIEPGTVHFAFDTVVGRDAILHQHVIFGPGVTVESGAEILPFCHIEGAHVSTGARIGPFARLRPGAEIGDDAHVGNFVEVKNTTLGTGAKANHLTYLGDAEVGEGTNIGAGTVTCNYDGVFKHRTVIGKRAFIGSDTMLVAPVRVGDDAMTATGTVVTSDVPDEALAIGRARQETKPGLAKRLMDRLRAEKAAGKKGNA